MISATSNMKTVSESSTVIPGTKHKLVSTQEGVKQTLHILTNTILHIGLPLFCTFNKIACYEYQSLIYSGGIICCIVSQCSILSLCTQWVQLDFTKVYWVALYSVLFLSAFHCAVFYCLSHPCNQTVFCFIIMLIYTVFRFLLLSESSAASLGFSLQWQRDLK